MDQVFSKENKTLKNTGKLEKILEKSGNFVSPEKWEPCVITETKQIVSCSQCTAVNHIQHILFVALRHLVHCCIVLYVL